MTNEIERITEIAKSVGFDVGRLIPDKIGIQGTADNLLAFSEEILAKQNTELNTANDTIDALRLALESEIARWRNACDIMNKQDEEIDHLKAQLAMQALNAEDRGLIINGLILERERSLKRKEANSESNSDLMADDCARLIKYFTEPRCRF